MSLSSLEPVSEKPWQGGPAIITSTPFISFKNSTISVIFLSQDRSLINASEFVWLYLNVSRAILTLSIPNTILNPASWNP